MPEDLPDDPVLLKQMLAQLLMERTVDKGQIVDLKEQVKLLRDRLFSRKSEQTVETNTPQLALFNEPERAASGSKCNSQLIMLSRLVASSCR